MGRTKRKRMNNLLTILLSVIFSLSIFLIVWVDRYGVAMNISFTKQSEGAETYVNSTSMSELLFNDEYSQVFRLDGNTYYKNIVDKGSFSDFRPSTYKVQNDNFSLSKVSKLPQGSGLTVRMLTPEKIRIVSIDSMLNSLATAGVYDAHIEIMSPSEVTGENALVGVYPFFVKNEIDRNRMELAHIETQWFVHLMGRYYTDITSPKRINQALAATKLTTKDSMQLSRKTTIREHLRDNWKGYELPDLSPEDEENISNWLLSYQKSEASKDKKTMKILTSIVEE